MIPRLGPQPIMEYDFPEPVWPYANKQQLYPYLEIYKISYHALTKISEPHYWYTLCWSAYLSSTPMKIPSGSTINLSWDQNE